MTIQVALWRRLASWDYWPSEGSSTGVFLTAGALVLCIPFWLHDLTVPVAAEEGESEQEESEEGESEEGESEEGESEEGDPEQGDAEQDEQESDQVTIDDDPNPYAPFKSNDQAAD